MTATLRSNSGGEFDTEGGFRAYKVTDPDTGIPLYRSKVPEGATPEDMRRLRLFDAKFNALLLRTNSFYFRRLFEVVETHGPYGPGVKPAYEQALEKQAEHEVSFMDLLEAKADALDAWADTGLKTMYPEYYQPNEASEE